MESPPRHRREQLDRSAVAFVVTLVLVCAAGLALTGACAAKFALPVLDTLTYLEVGRNLLKGRGFVERFNFLHAWSGRTAYPGMAYYNPAYGLVLGILWELLNPRTVAVVATALPCCLNAALLAVIVRRTMGSLTAILSAVGFLLLSTTWTSILIITAEHPALTVILLSLLVIQDGTRRRNCLCAGVILGLGYFVKVGIATVVPGVIAAIVLTQPGSPARRLRASGQPVLWLVGGIVLVVVPYVVLAKLLVGGTYPVYARSYHYWALAHRYGGHYVAATPAVQVDPARLPGFAERATNVLWNQWQMLRGITSELGLLAAPLIVGLVAARGEVRRQAVVLLAVGASAAMGHAAALNWEHMDKAWAGRYAIYAAPLWYPVAAYGIVWLAGRVVRIGEWRTVVAVLMWVVLSLPTAVPRFSRVRSVLATEQPRVVQFQQVATRIAALIGPDELVAVDPRTYTAVAAAFLDRPVVSLPFEAMDTPQSYREFVEVFHPALIIPGTTRNPYQVLPALGYEPKRIPELDGMIVFLHRR